MYKQNGNLYGKYFNPKNGPQEPKAKRVWRQIWKWTKIVLFLFILVSLLWGCIQMYQPDYTVQGAVDMTGATVYVPGTSFELITSVLGQHGGQTHNSNGAGINAFGESAYNVITSWGDAWKVTKSPFYGLFVYPMAFLLNSFIWLFNPGEHLNPTMDQASRTSYGIAVIFAIFVTVLIIRSLTLAFSWKSQKNQEKMQDLQLKQTEITEKYKGKKDMASRQKQQMEMQALYKKEGLTPFSAITLSIASMPFLIAMFAVVRSTLSLKIASVGKISLIDQPWQSAINGEPVYLALIFTYLPLQILSMFLPTFLQMKKQKGKKLTEAQKKSRKRNLIMQIIFAVMFIFFVASVASGVAIYWIFSSAFQIFQTLAFHLYNTKHQKKGSQEKNRRLRQAKKKQPKLEAAK